MDSISHFEEQCFGELQASIKNVVARAESAIPTDTDETACPDFTPYEFDIIAMMYNNLISKVHGLKPVKLRFEQLIFNKAPFKSPANPVCRRHMMIQMENRFKGGFYPYFMSSEPNEEKRGQLPSNWYSPSIQGLRLIFTCFVRSYNYYSSIFMCEIKSLLSDRLGEFECVHREFVNLSAYREFRGRVMDNIMWILTKTVHSIDCNQCLPCFANHALVPSGVQPPFDYETVHKMSLRAGDDVPTCLHSEYAARKDVLTIYKAYTWYFAGVSEPRTLFQELQRRYCEEEEKMCPGRGFMFHAHVQCPQCQRFGTNQRANVMMAIEDLIIKSYGKYETFFETYAGTEHNRIAAQEEQRTIAATLQEQKKLYFVPTAVVVNKLELCLV